MGGPEAHPTLWRVGEVVEKQPRAKAHGALRPGGVGSLHGAVGNHWRVLSRGHCK